MRVPLKGLNRVRKRLASGKWVTYYYAWKGGPRLTGEYGSPEFHASYNFAVQGCVRRPEKDLRSLIDRYLDSSAFSKLAPRTKKDYKYHIKAIEAEFGDLPISALADRGVRADFLGWRDRFGKRAPRQADLAFRVLARVISWGFNLGIAPANPCERAGIIHKNGTRVDKIWTDEDEAAFIEKAPERLRLAIQLALWTGQRQGDLLDLTWDQYDGETIRLRQSKTKARVEIPVGEPLRLALEAAKAKLRESGVDKAALESRPILSTLKGTRWSGDGFRTSWRKACECAGIEDLTFHDLRGTAVTRLAVAGCTVPEIATITGHSLRDAELILQAHYMNHDPQLAKNAIRKLENRTKRPTKRPTAAGRLSKSAEKSS